MSPRAPSLSGGTVTPVATSLGDVVQEDFWWPQGRGSIAATFTQSPTIYFLPSSPKRIEGNRDRRRLLRNKYDQQRPACPCTLLYSLSPFKDVL